MSNENEADESSVLRDEIASLCRIVKEPGKTRQKSLPCFADIAPSHRLIARFWFVLI